MAYVFPYDTDEFAGSGRATYYALGLGARLHLLPSLRTGDLWIGGGPDLVITGDLVRAGLNGGAGLDLAVGESGLTVGPFTRYVHVFQPNGGSQGGADGRVFQIGVALTWGPRPSPEPEPEVTPEPEPEPQVTPEPEPEPEPEITPEPEPEVIPEPEPAAESVPLPQRVPFGFNSDYIGQRGEGTLREVASALRRRPDIEQVRIVGHSDDLGDADYNRDLSERRARNVARWLVEHGIDANRLTTIGVGASQPRVQGSTPEELAPNRRVEFEVLPPPSGIAGGGR
jgi:outer membrane protein OmpA-like peptidoglycan-associated protein